MSSSESTVWEHGLRLGNLTAALRPELVDQTVDYKSAANRIQSIFQYDDVIVDNPLPAQSPKLFKSCQELHPGVCESHVASSFVLETVDSFQRHLDHHKVKLPALCCLDFTIGGGNGASSSSAEPSSCLRNRSYFRSWYMVGCVSKKPLCHVLAPLQPFPQVENSLVFQICTRTHCINLCTSYSVILAAAEQAIERAERFEDLVLEFSAHDFQMKAFHQHPNLVVFRRSFATFRLGKGCAPCPPKSSDAPAASKSEVALPFGLQFTQKPKPKKRPAVDKDVVQDDGPPKPKSRKTDKGDRDKSKSKTDSGCVDSGDGNGCEDDDGTFLSDEQLMQLKSAISQLDGFAEEEAQIADEKNRVEKRKGVSGSGASFFHKELGIISMKEARRNMVCLHCNNRIEKGSIRFEYAFHLAKPQRSIHTECVGQIASNSEALLSSIKWLRTELSRSQCTSVDRQVIKQSLASLEALQVAK